MSDFLTPAIAAATASGDAAVFSAAVTYRGWLGLRQSDPPTVEADAQTMLEDMPAPMIRATAVLVEARLEQGRGQSRFGWATR